MWTKLILLLGLWWLWRMAMRLGRPSRRKRQDVGGSQRGDSPRSQADARDHGDLTRQDISDADYEEIP